MVPAKEFRDWIGALEPKITMTRIAELTGVKRTALYGQLVRGQVPERLVVNAARRVRLDPVQALASFEQYGDLGSLPGAPSEGELLSQCDYESVLAEVLDRGERSQHQNYELAALPFRGSVRAWVEAIDSERKLRSHLANHADISEAAVSAQISANRLTPDLAVAAAGFADTSHVAALVVTGVITEEEGGWPAGARMNALKTCGQVDLIELASYWLARLRRARAATEKEDAIIESIWENLG